MSKRAEITSEDEYRGWWEMLNILDEMVASCDDDTRQDFTGVHERARLAAATKARDSLLGPIRKWQESGKE